VYLSFAAGAEMWKRRGWNFYPRWQQESFGTDLSQGMGRGYLLCLVLLGVQSLLFLIAENYFDMWATNDPATSPYNMLWPVLFPLLAWGAAISEEAVYRVFGIILFTKLLKNTFLAVLVPSMIWALGHTQYSVFPVYTRFFEVTLLGIILGYAFLKYGFMTVLFAHAIMDSILMAFSLISLGGFANVFIGLFYIGFPALIAWLLSRLHKRFISVRRAAHPQEERI
ncbi:MAG TPA: CPBP family intramembrane glutamic endopeptidase, partial [Bacilli bacterium]